MVPNSIVGDSKLSLKAKWMYLYLRSKPEWRDFSSVRMKMENSDWRCSILSSLRELETFWLIERAKMWNWRVAYFFSEPESQNQSLDPKPKSEKCTEGKTHSAKTCPIYNNKKTSNTESINKTNINLHFSSFWELYPKKVNKKKALDTFTKAYKNMNIKDLLRWLELYNLYIEQTWVAKEYIMQPTTFLAWNRWEDDFTVINKKDWKKLNLYERKIPDSEKNFFEGI